MARAGVKALAASVPEVTLREAFQQAASRLLPEPRPVAGRVADAGIGGLTSREREVAGLVGRGLTNKQIAIVLVVEKRTVETHIGNILAKLGYSSRAQLIALAIERGLVSGPP
jgi:DNA-binding NarL/FixJ family response regulator